MLIGGYQAINGDRQSAVKYYIKKCLRLSMSHNRNIVINYISSKHVQL